MNIQNQKNGQRLLYTSDASESASSGPLPDLLVPVDVISYLTVASAWHVDIIPYTWLPSLGDIGQGQSGTIQQSIANLQTSFAFKTFDDLGVREAFNEATSEIQVLGNPSIREHPNIIELEGICWNILPGGEVRPVLVFEKTDLGSLFTFMETKRSDPVSIKTRLQLSTEIIQAVSKLHSCNIFHGDIKPANVLLFASASELFTAKITDFSFAVLDADGRSFTPYPGTTGWRDPDYNYRSQWSFNRAKGADIYSLGLLLQWLIFHGHPNTLELPSQSQDTNQREQTLSRLCQLVGQLELSNHLKGALKLLFLVCFNPDAEQRALRLNMQMLRKRDLNDEDLKKAIDWERFLPAGTVNDNSQAQLSPLHYPASLWPSNKQYQLNLFDIATSLYSAHFRVRASITEALHARIKGKQYPSATDIANLAVCFQLGFGTERSDTEYERLMSRLDHDIVKRTTEGLENFRANYKYQYYKDSKFRVAFKMGHLDAIDLAQVYSKSSDVENIEIWCRRELEDVKRALGETHHIACTLTSTLAALYYVRDNLKIAACLQESLLKTYLKKYGDSSRHTQSAKINLASSYREIGHYEKAETLYTEVLNARSKDLDKNHVDTLLVKSNLATMYLIRGLWDRAEQSLREVVQHSVTVLGNRHPHLVVVRGNFASALQNNGKLIEAEEELRAVLEISGKLYEQAHPSNLIKISNLMSVYNDGRLQNKAANEHLIRTEHAALDAGKSLGTCHGLTLKIYTNVAQAYIIRDRYHEALGILNEIICKSAGRMDESHPDMLTMKGTLFHILYKQEKWEEAEKLSLQLLGNMDEQKNPDYPVVLGNLAAVYARQMKFSMAVGEASRVYEMQIARCGKEHRLTSLAKDALSRYQAAAETETTAEALH
ncbi:kinase-like protein [Plenodomus tracheiphilus IPT5]|uniref:Kinase-like protein n=1 Tax=Plenodomus tracheiphilus IPT5 TaxID=1408161 RepID=A0A6A7BB88_9PLEO|nr:kinase-like protein [Plenodomus tracheiphilus IPT5]